MRTLLFLLALLIAGMVAWFAFDSATEYEHVAAEPTTADSSLEEPTAPADLSQPATAPASAEGANTSTREALAHQPAAGRIASNLVTITGTVVLIDAQENVFGQESGSLWVSPQPELPAGFEVAVEAGRFSFELGDGVSFEIESVELGGEDCVLGEPPTDLSASEGLQLELEVYRRVPATLIVRDRESGADLAGLELWNNEGWSLSPSLIPVSPSHAKVELTNPTSPVRLPLRDGKQTWWVRKEGYSWETVQFDHRFGGERIVVLDKEATLSVHVENRLGGEALDVFLTKDHFAERSHSLTVGASEPSEFRVGGLSGGPCVIKIGRTKDKRRNRYVTTQVFLIAGEVAVARLTLPPLERENSTKTVFVSGTLELPPENTQEPSRLKWLWQGDNPGPEQTDVTARFEPMTSGTNRWSWETDELVPGPWQVTVTPFGHVEDLHIGPRGATDIALRITSLAEVLVRVQGRDTGEPVRDPDVSFFRKGGEFDAYGGSAWDTEEPGVSSLLLSPGTYRLEVHAEGFLFDGKTITVGTTDQEVLFELKETASMVVVLKEGTTVVPQEITWWLAVEAEHMGGEGYITSRSFSGGSASMSAGVTEPGLYRLTLGEVDGYLPIEPLEVLLDHGENEIEIQLRRK